jgi:hypothetical protein
MGDGVDRAPIGDLLGEMHEVTGLASRAPPRHPMQNVRCALCPRSPAVKTDLVGDPGF